MRTINKLTVRQVETISAKGRYSDGGNLYLVVTAAGTRQWVFRYRWSGGEREIGLGSAAPGRVTLAQARKIAQTSRDALAEGRDPAFIKKEAKEAAQAARTFGQVADEFLEAKGAGWRNPKHRKQWEYSLKTLAEPIRSQLVHELANTDVLSVLRPLWTTVPETARRLRGRIEAVLVFATRKGYRKGENPATWKDNLKDLLPRHDELSRGHHAALDYADMPAFTEKLRRRESRAAQALELVILTATRTSEVLGAQWDEIDLEKKLWAIPATRMKAKREHRVPLSGRAIEILQELSADRWSPFVFPSNTGREALSNMSMLMLLRRMGYDKITVHGFRSTFRDWAGETTSFPHEVCEQALAHTIKNKAEAAYRRGDMLAKRALLMEAWANFIEPAKADNVIPMMAAG
ncbi:MAG: tyrosine-type recombinase/integrase [Sphingobium sp.]